MGCGFNVYFVIILEWIIFLVVASGVSNYKEVDEIENDFRRNSEMLLAVMILCGMNILLSVGLYVKNSFACKTWAIFTIIQIGVSLFQVGYFIVTTQHGYWLTRIGFIMYKSYAVQTVIKFAIFINRDNTSSKDTSCGTASLSNPHSPASTEISV